MYTFGGNNEGQLGDGTTTERLTPTLIVASGVASVTCGLVHTAYITTAGALYTFGGNNSGQLGDGTRTQRRTPTLIVASGVASVSCGSLHTAYLTTSGALYTFGFGLYGQLGDGARLGRESPTLIVASGVESVACGAYHTLYLKDGSAYATGDNFYGQLGNGATLGLNDSVIFNLIEFNESSSYFSVSNEKFVFNTNSRTDCYALFDDIDTAHLFGFVYNPIQLFGGYVRFNDVNGNNQVTFQECGWLKGDKVYDSTYSYLDDTIYKFVNSISLYIGKQLIQEFDSASIKFIQDTNTVYKNRPVLKLLNGDSNIVDYERIYYFDIPFIQVPMHAISRQDVQIRVKLNPLNYFDFYASLVLSYDKFFTTELPRKYIIEVPQISYFSNIQDSIDVRGPIKKLIIKDGFEKVLFNGEEFSNEKLSKPYVFENLLNTPLDNSNVVVFNNPINMSRIRDQTVRGTSTVYSETTNLLNISNELSGLMFDVTESKGSFPIVTGNITNPLFSNVTYLFDQIPNTTSSLQCFYSMRLVSPVYYGPVVRLRNATTNEEADFYTDTTQSFLKTSNGISVTDFGIVTSDAATTQLRIVTWYDQSLNKNNLTQVFPYVQPFLVTKNGKYVVHIYNDTSITQQISPTCWMDITKPVHPQQFLMCVYFNYLASTYYEPDRFTSVFSTTYSALRLTNFGYYRLFYEDTIDWPVWENTQGFNVYANLDPQPYSITGISQQVWENMVGVHNKLYTGDDISVIGISPPGPLRTTPTSMNGYFFEIGFASNKTLKGEYDNYYANRPPVF